MPSSRQLRSIRERVSENADPFARLFRDAKFKARFPDGFSRERTATRPPRGFDPQHPRLDWLKLQGFYVWRSYKKKEYTSPKFAEMVARDGEQLLRLNELLTQAITGRWPEKLPTNVKRRAPAPLVADLSDGGDVRLPQHDF